MGIFCGHVINYSVTLSQRKTVGRTSVPVAQNLIRITCPFAVFEPMRLLEAIVHPGSCTPDERPSRSGVILLPLSARLDKFIYVTVLSIRVDAGTVSGMDLRRYGLLTGRPTGFTVLKTPSTLEDVIIPVYLRERVGSDGVNAISRCPVILEQNRCTSLCYICGKS